MNILDQQQLKIIIECALLAAGEPVSIDRLLQLFAEEEQPEKSVIRETLGIIADECQQRGFLLKEVASGFCLQIQPQYQQWISRLWEKRPPRYSRALLETLALIAYRQPITRAEIEEVRGVSVASTTFKILMEREWVRVVGHRDVPGKPALYATTKQFLDYFNLKNLEELPPLAELSALLTTANEPLDSFSNNQSPQESLATTPEQQSEIIAQVSTKVDEEDYSVEENNQPDLQAVAIEEKML